MKQFISFQNYFYFSAQLSCTVTKLWFRQRPVKSLSTDSFTLSDKNFFLERNFFHPWEKIKVKQLNQANKVDVAINHTLFFLLKQHLCGDVYVLLSVDATPILQAFYTLFVNWDIKCTLSQVTVVFAISKIFIGKIYFAILFILFRFQIIHVYVYKLQKFNLTKRNTSIMKTKCIFYK